MKLQTSNPPLEVTHVTLPGAGAVAQGRPLKLTLRLGALRDVRVDRVEVELVRRLRYGYGRGNVYGFVYTAWEETEDILSRTALPGPGAMSSGTHCDCDATLEVPVDGPPTMHGSLIESTWHVRIRAESSLAGDIISEHPITVQSTADAFQTDSSSPELLSDQQTAWMEIQQLPSRVLHGGDMLSGELRVRALSYVNIRSIRVELLLCETVEHGPGRGPSAARSPFEDRKDTETVISRQDLAGWKLDEGESVVLPFTLQAPPELPAPSLDMPNFHTSWLLRATLNVPLRADPRLDVGLTAVTTTNGS